MCKATEHYFIAVQTKKIFTSPTLKNGTTETYEYKKLCVNCGKVSELK